MFQTPAPLHRPCRSAHAERDPQTTRCPAPWGHCLGPGGQLRLHREDVDLLPNVCDNTPRECKPLVGCQSVLSKENASDERDAAGGDRGPCPRLGGVRRLCADSHVLRHREGVITPGTGVVTPGRQAPRSPSGSRTSGETRRVKTRWKGSGAGVQSGGRDPTARDDGRHGGAGKRSHERFPSDAQTDGQRAREEAGGIEGPGEWRATRSGGRTDSTSDPYLHR